MPLLLTLPSYHYHGYHQLDSKIKDTHHVGPRQHLLTLLLWLFIAVKSNFGLSILSELQHAPAAEIICGTLLCGQWVC